MNRNEYIIAFQMLFDKMYHSGDYSGYGVFDEVEAAFEEWYDETIGPEVELEDEE